MAYTDIDDPELYFQTKIWSGNGGTQAITFDGSENMQPDWVWIKRRNDTNAHTVLDSVRGATKSLRADATEAEETRASSLTSFDSNGFTLGSDGNVNASGGTYVAWNWKKVAGVFDIQTYAGNSNGSRTVAHNLGVVPSLIIVKNRTNAADWFVGSTTSGVSFNWATDYFRLNEAAAKGTDSGGNLFGAVPTDSVFTPGTNNDMNGSNNNYVAYLFGNKQGVSKVGSYVGNGNANGTFVYTGFKPAWILRKNASTGSRSWNIYDVKRGINPNGAPVFADTTAAEASGDNIVDLLSNGFKQRATGGGGNTSGDIYVYMAFAENPFVTSTGVPATAR